MKADRVTTALARVWLAAVSGDEESVRDELVELTRHSTPAEIAKWMVSSVKPWLHTSGVRQQTRIAKQIVEAQCD